MIEPTASQGRSPAWVWGLLLLILAVSVVPRLPWLANAARTFNSDEAVDALVMEHLLHRGEITLYNWDAHYYGIAEGVLTLPFLAAGVAVPLASKLGSLVGFLALLVAVFLLGRRLFDPAAGLAAAALLAAFSPQVVQWSILASGGYCLVVAWGTLTLLQFERLRRRPSRAGLVGLGFLVGFGLYIYELFLVYVATLACAWGVGSLLWRLVLAPDPQARAREIRTLPRRLAGAGLFLAGFVLGWAPKLALLLFGNATGGKKPLYTLAPPRQILANLRLLVTQCIPAFLGIDPAADPRLAFPLGGHPWPASATLGLLLILVYTIAWLAGALRVRREIEGAFARPPGGLGGEALLVLLPPIVGVLFLLSPNPQDALSNRYLLPWLSSLPVLGGAFLVRLGRRGRGARAAAWALGALLVVFPLVQIVHWHQDGGYLDARLHLLHPPDELEGVLRYLRQEGIRGGYGSYWIAYKATLLAGERIIIAPLGGWDRHPAYTYQVGALPTEAYLFFGGAPGAARFGFPARLAGRSFVARELGPFLVYTSPEHRRLLPAIVNPSPLLKPRARILARVPPTAGPGETLVIPVEVTNRSDGVWSATGALETGMYRVVLSYRWFGENGRPVVAEGTRFRLPRDLPPDAAAVVTERIPVPSRPGRYRLRLTLVQEGVTWFDDARDAGGKGSGSANFPVEVQVRAAPQAA